MNSSLIGKIEKAKRYALERERVRFQELRVTFRGENDTHEVAFHDNRWRCTCDFFEGWGMCSHTMAMERILQGMVPERSTAAAAARNGTG
ncbi:MAG TPA: hypothetical protein VIO14_07945 [Dehalococcoidia bacterium]